MIDPRSLLGRWRPSVPAVPVPGVVATPRAYGGIELRHPAGKGDAEPLGRLGPLEVRLARKPKDVRRAQKLRYKVFYREMSAIADARTRLARRDIDPFDAICDHLLVRDNAAVQLGLRRKPKVVGTYRLLRQDVAVRHGGFYSASEFDVGGLFARHPGSRFLELGRSCVLAPFRDKRTVELLWRGVWAYVLEHRIDVMFGCASLEGTDPDRLALPLSFLHHFAAAPESWRARAWPSRSIEMNRMPSAAVEPKAAWRELPPLIKGYLRLGAFVSEGAVIDRQFGTTDVLIVLPVAAINARYIRHFGADAARHAT